ncbi:NADH-quinone oxidoreductase subunit J family protein [Aquisphaera insulae]|uniref:NADH-quinone oxidoreductase subunit J family protein n=1 Tax=Aquisphaera insulae TaxID=2712864 RepID=UPI0013EB2C31|nr:NADH-quinone oxidoreductase subunit J [Aquisphaera insulae]
MLQIVFFVIAGFGLLAALGAVLARNLVHAGLFLVGYFFAVAAVFVLLEAEFLAALQVLVYIGAVAIILMFGIMLTRNIQGDDTTILVGRWRAPAMVAGLLLFGVLVFGINNAVTPPGQPSWQGRAERPSIVEDMTSPPGTAARRDSINNMGRMVGLELMKRYVVGFEVAGLLLTAALVGAIALAHRDEDEPGAAASGDRAADRTEPAAAAAAEAGLAASGGRASS